MASWDEDQEHEIIRYVREHPCFYDTKSPDYKNRDLRSAEWENLAGKFDVTGVFSRQTATEKTAHFSGRHEGKMEGAQRRLQPMHAGEERSSFGFWCGQSGVAQMGPLREDVVSRAVPHSSRNVSLQWIAYPELAHERYECIPLGRRASHWKVGRSERSSWT